MSIPVSARSIPLGETLVRRGIITAEQRDQALDASGRSGRRIGETLVEMGFVTKETVTRILAGQVGIPFVDLRKGLADPRISNVIPRERAEIHGILPLFRVQGTLSVAFGNPHKTFLIDELSKLTGCEINPVVALEDRIHLLTEECYSHEDVPFDELTSDLDETDLEVVSIGATENYEDITEKAGESPIINLVNQIILRAVKERASDIHIEPERKYFRARFRIDGVLYDALRQRIDLLAPVVSRLKILAGVDIAERRLPQDGRIQVVVQGRVVDLRFSSLPGVLGEKVVLRLLDKERGILSLEELGFGNQTLDMLRELLRRPNGLILVTGPTGSGKTTTLYSGLCEVNSLEKNIVTIEDPVEYQFEIINQNQVREDIGLTFAKILKHALRQDPDIVMVGEIRDSETAQIAVQAALTGHLVLTTVHTNDAASSVTRILEMGIEPYLLAPSLIGVVAQRLVRTICDDCGTSYLPSKTEIEAIGHSEESSLRLRKGRGCGACFDSGYKGRIGIYEMLVADEEFRRLLLEGAGVDRIRQFQAKMEMPTLRSESIKRVIEGKTTLAEVTRAILVD